MGLRQWMETTKDALDFGREFPAVVADRRRRSAQDSADLRQALAEAQEACRLKDDLIAELRSAGATKAEMVTDGSAYYIRKRTSFDGPFCASCFQRNHEMSRITIAAKAREADAGSADWVQCVKCRVPFQSNRVSGYLNSRKTDAASPLVSPDDNGPQQDAPMPPKRRVRTRRPRKAPSREFVLNAKPAAKPSKPRARRSATSRKRSAKNTISPTATLESPSASHLAEEDPS